MTEAQKQNLISLIKSSPILSAQEREEWLMLMDLMNDKQVGELEQILTPKPAAPIQPPANLPLNHIVNLPRQEAAKAKTFSKFADHLNQILKEKDLPVGEKAPLDLPKPVAPKPVEPKPSALKPLPPKPIAPFPPKTLNLQPRVGLQNQDALFQAALLKQQQPKPAPAPVATQPAALSSGTHLESPADAASLSLGQWKGEDRPTLAEKLKKISAKESYHQLIFNLQKSPLYAVYIDSGLKSLQSGKNFEGLGENYMSKKEFEDFTDMLRELQV